jgi:hypothetical protein
VVETDAADSVIVIVEETKKRLSPRYQKTMF